MPSQQFLPTRSCSSLSTVLSFPFFPLMSYHLRNSPTIHFHFSDKKITEKELYRVAIALAAILPYQYCSRSMYYFSIISIIWPLLVVCNMSMIFSILSIECCFSRRYWANLDLWLLCLKSLSCSWYRILNGFAVCLLYFILHVGHFNWLIPDLSYIYL